MVFQTEKMLKENGDNMPADVKSEAEAKLADLPRAPRLGSWRVSARLRGLTHNGRSGKTGAAFAYISAHIRRFGRTCAACIKT